MSTSSTTSHLSWVKEFALKVLGLLESFWSVAEPILASSTQQLLAQLLPIAVSVVAGLATDTGKSGDEKRQAAVDQIKAAAIAQGITASTSLVNAAVELAVQQLKGSSATASATPAPASAS